MTVWKLTATETSNLPVSSRTVSMMYDKILIALNAGWNLRSDTEEGRFNFYVMFNILFARITNAWSSTLATN